MDPSKYAVLCAMLCGLANFITSTGYYSIAFISESVLHSVNGRDPERIGAHDGYYGLAVSNAFYMLSTLAVPSLMNYFRCKGLAASVLFFASPALSIYSYAMILSAFLIVATIVYLYACNFVLKEEKKNTDQVAPIELEKTHDEKF